MKYFLTWYYELRPSVWYKKLSYRMKGMEDQRKFRKQAEKLELEKPQYKPHNGL
jgi:hypothetical protein